MKISVDDVELYTLSPHELAVIKNDINADEFDADMKRRLKYVLNHKYERCFARLKAEWDNKLPANGISTIPTDAKEYAQLVFSQPNYKDRKSRDSEAA